MVGRKSGNLDNGILAESYLQDISTLAAGGLIDLGNAFTVGAQDLVFRYRTSGGAFIDAAVQYVTSAAVAGDYNNNGVVDAADYVLCAQKARSGKLAGRGRDQSWRCRHGRLQLLAITIWGDSRQRCCPGR